MTFDFRSHAYMILGTGGPSIVHTTAHLIRGILCVVVTRKNGQQRDAVKTIYAVARKPTKSRVVWWRTRARHNRLCVALRAPDCGRPVQCYRVRRRDVGGGGRTQRPPSPFPPRTNSLYSLPPPPPPFIAYSVLRFHLVRLLNARAYAHTQLLPYKIIS